MQLTTTTLPIEPSLPEQELELSIRCGTDSDGYVVCLYNLTANQLMAEMESHCDLHALKCQYLNRLKRYLTEKLPDGFLVDFGRALARTILPARIEGQLINYLICRANRQNTCLRLRIEAPALSSIPWEYLVIDAPIPLVEQDADTPAQIKTSYPCFLARVPRLLLVRTPTQKQNRLPQQVAEHRPAYGTQEISPRNVWEPPHRRPTPEIRGSIRILLVTADPRTEEHARLIYLQEEINAITAALGPRNVTIRLLTNENANRDQLQKELVSFGPHLLYISGHGSNRATDGVIHLYPSKDNPSRDDPSRDEAGELSGAELAGWLAGSDVRLVVLSACDSHTMAHTLASSGVPAVLAMQMKLRPKIAVSFARNLFLHLAQPSTIAEALRQSREHIEPDSLPDWGIPILYQTGGGLVFPQPTRSCPIKLPRPRNLDFQGREELLPRIHQLVQERALTLAGMGGIGKTEIALHYASRYASNYPGGVFFLDARSPESIEDDFIQIASILGFDDTAAPGEMRRVLADRARHYFLTLHVPSLLVCDDIQNEQEIYRLLPISEQCHLMFTTRRTGILEDTTHVETIPPLAPEAAFKLLTRHSSALSPTETEYAQEIVQACGNHPLALFLISAHTRKQKLTFQQYHCVMRTWPGLDKLTTTLRTSYGALLPSTQSVLKIAACYASQGISLPLLRQACQNQIAASPHDVNHSLTELVDYSLISFETPIAGEEPRLTLHELVRDFTHHQFGKEEWEATLGTLGTQLANYLNKVDETGEWSQAYPEIPHCHAILRLQREHHLHTGYLELLRNLGIYYSQQGDYDQAKSLFAEGRDFTTSLRSRGNEGLAASDSLQIHLDHAWFGMYEAHMSQLLHSPEEALTLIQTALRSAESLLPSGDERLVDYYLCYGLILKLQGRYVEAEPLYQNALSICKKQDENENTHGNFNKSFASCLNNLGTLYESQGEIDKALETINQALEIGEKSVGPNHTRIAIFLNNLGRLLVQKSEYTIALAHHQRAREIYLKAFGLLNRNVATSLYYMGYALAEAGKIGDALPLIDQAYSIVLKLFGPDHPSTIYIHNRLCKLRES